MILGLRDVRQNPQGLRHEWASLLILDLLRPWLIPAVNGDEVDWSIVTWAIAGHHPSPHHESPPTRPPKEGDSGPEIRLLMGHPDFTPILFWLVRAFSLGDPPASL